MSADVLLMNLSPVLTALAAGVARNAPTCFLSTTWSRLTRRARYAMTDQELFGGTAKTSLQKSGSHGLHPNHECHHPLIRNLNCQHMGDGICELCKKPSDLAAHADYGYHDMCYDILDKRNSSGKCIRCGKQRDAGHHLWCTTCGQDSPYEGYPGPG